jgi:hypothetical protein
MYHVRSQAFSFLDDDDRKEFGGVQAALRKLEISRKVAKFQVDARKRKAAGGRAGSAPLRKRMR